MFTRIKGTQDFLDLTLCNFLINSAQKHLTTYHFTQIATPILEQLSLFQRSLGLETDVVTKEMYIVQSGNITQNITTHEQGEEIICLRPEGTASIMRAFFNNNVDTIPWKVFSYGPMFRHERPQKGRYRQFHQISIENLGAESIAHDVELITMLDRFFHEVLSLNSYALLINFLGCIDDRANFKQVLLQFLEKNSTIICATCTERKDKNIMRVFDCKNPTCQELYRSAPHIVDSLCTACNQEWETLKNLLLQLSVSFSVAPTLVRGLDYYNKTVFEFVSTELGAQNTFCGGGRYDMLAQTLGEKKPLPALGAAIGIERVVLMLENIQSRLTLPQLPPLTTIVPISAEQHALALLLADQLRAHNLCVEVLLDGESTKSMMRKANKMGSAFCLIIGSEEQASGQVTLKNMINGTETKIAHIDVVKTLLGK